MQQVIVIRLDRQRLALHARDVERVLHAAALTPLPNAPAVVSGVLDLAGDMLPVLSLRVRLGLPSRVLRSSDVFVITAARGHRLGLIADDIDGVIELRSERPLLAGPLAAPLAHLRGVAKINDELALIHDVEAFLNDDESEQLTMALARRRDGDA